MNSHRTLLLSLLLLALASGSSAQTTGVRTEYMKSDKTTRVETNLLYVYNTPDQFVEIMLRAWYKGEKVTKAPTKVELTFFSISAKRALYRGERGLVAVTDGEEWKVGTPQEDFVMRGESKDGKETFYFDLRPGIGMQVNLPASALVRGGGGVNGLIAEWLPMDLKQDQFSRFANSKTAALRLANSSFTLTEGQMKIIRAFASSITPE